LLETLILRGDSIPGRQRLSRNRAADDRQGKTEILNMEKPLKKAKLPRTDSIQKMAAFWDKHDLTDYEDELEEAAGPVFVRGAALQVHLDSDAAKALKELAQAKGVSQEELVRSWVLPKLASRRNTGRPKKQLRRRR
jgi:hypothetical protein